jgi:hypothetical protein
MKGEVDMKKWLAAFVLTVCMVLSTFANIGVVFAEERTATLVVVGDSERGAILCPKKVEFNEGATAFDVLNEAFPNKLVYSGTGDMLYLTGIDGLVAGEKYKQSYWALETNNEMAMVGVGGYQVKNGDIIAMRFIEDWNAMPTDTLKEQLKKISECDLSLLEPVKEPPTTPDPGTTPKEVDTNKAIADAAAYLLRDGINSEWEAIGLLRSGAVISNDVKASYIEQLKDNVQNKRMQGGKLAKTILAINAVGSDPTKFVNQNLVEKLYNDQTLADVYAYSAALLALDSRKYDIPAGAFWSREKLVDAILSQQRAEGGWGTDADTNSMMLIALAPYSEKPEVAKAQEKTLKLLQSMQGIDGGFDQNANSTALVLTALSIMGINPTDAEWTKEANVIENLVTFQQTDGGFKWQHTSEASDALSSEQALYALVQYTYFVQEKGSIFDWSSEPINTPETPNEPTIPEPSQPPVPETPEISVPTETVNKPVPSEMKTAEPVKEKVKQTLPDTALFDTVFWSSLAAGFVLIMTAVLVWRRII